MTIHYLENRIWFLGAEVLLEKAAGFNHIISLGSFKDKTETQFDSNLRLPIHANLVVRPVSLWTLDNKYPDALTLKIDAETEQVICRYVDVDQGWPMHSIRLAIHVTGFLYMISEYKNIQIDNNEKLETTTEIIQESLDRLYPFLAYLVDQLHNAGLIHKSSYLHFGVPPGELQDNQYDVFGTYCTVFDAFSYNQHFVIITNSDTETSKLLRSTGLEDEYIEIDGIRLWIGNSMRVWSGSSTDINQGLMTIMATDPINWDSSLSENGFVRAFWVESLQLSKQVITSTAQTVYVKLLLRNARQEDSLEPEQMRSILDLNNGLFQQLSLYEWRLDEGQSELLCRLEEKSRGQVAIDGFRSAEANLVASVEGQESLSSRQLSRATESILFVLTILSVYSISSDVASFLGSSDDLMFSWPPRRLGVIISATAVISLVLVFLQQRLSLNISRRKHKKNLN
jgi:hypothetical protein